MAVSNFDDYGQDPFSGDARIYGARGYTAAAVEILTPWLTSEWSGGLRRIDGVPAEVAEHIATQHLPTTLTEELMENYPPMLELVAVALMLSCKSTAEHSSEWSPSARRRGRTSRIRASSSPSWMPQSTRSIAERQLHDTSAPFFGHDAT